MTRCPITTSCCYPQGECSGLCLHRACINTDTMTKRSVSIKGKVEQRMPIEFAGPEPEDKPESLWSRVWSAYKAHRPHGRMNGIRHAFAAWRN